jgi:hypothetical protein
VPGELRSEVDAPKMTAVLTAEAGA